MQAHQGQLRTKHDPPTPPRGTSIPKGAPGVS